MPTVEWESFYSSFPNTSHLTPLADHATMSEFVPAGRPRIVRILCLHGVGQSAASFRALLGPLLPRLPRNYEVHFLDAPYVVADSEIAGSEDREQAEYRRAIEECSVLDALKGLHKAQELRKEMETTRGQSKAGSSSKAAGFGQSADDIAGRIGSLEKKLGSTSVGQSVFESYSRAGIDECETLLAKSGYVAPDRDWLLPPSESPDGGLQHSLGKVSDYTRTSGPFHGAITAGPGTSSHLLALLLSPLLDEQTHPQSALEYPLVFPLLPMQAPAPRMGGWEVMPSMPLPSGRRTAITQGPLGFIIAMGGGAMPNDQLSKLEKETGGWRLKQSASASLHSLVVARSGASQAKPAFCDRVISASKDGEALLS